ncbi:hypothetical protein V1527DRAFT_472655 [Lipomyces starkeyi]
MAFHSSVNYGIVCTNMLCCLCYQPPFSAAVWHLAWFRFVAVSGSVPVLSCGGYKMLR